MTSCYSRSLEFLTCSLQCWSVNERGKHLLHSSKAMTSTMYDLYSSLAKTLIHIWAVLIRGWSWKALGVINSTKATGIWWSWKKWRQVEINARLTVKHCARSHWTMTVFISKDIKQRHKHGLPLAPLAWLRKS